MTLNVLASMMALLTPSAKGAKPGAAMAEGSVSAGNFAALLASADPIASSVATADAVPTPVDPDTGQEAMSVVVPDVPAMTPVVQSAGTDPAPEEKLAEEQVIAQAKTDAPVRTPRPRKAKAEEDAPQARPRAKLRETAPESPADAAPARSVPNAQSEAMPLVVSQPVLAPQTAPVAMTKPQKNNALSVHSEIAIKPNRINISTDAPAPSAAPVAKASSTPAATALPERLAALPAAPPEAPVRGQAGARVPLPPSVSSVSSLEIPASAALPAREAVSLPPLAAASLGEATALLSLVRTAPVENGMPKGADFQAISLFTPLSASLPRGLTPASDVTLPASTPSVDAGIADTGASIDKIATIASPVVVGSPLPMAPATPTAPGVSPALDVATTLGQQVIDMQSGGQWIDGLAREIAALSTGEGKGSFRLSPAHLGPMRVDILPGDKGAEVRLTVETQAAETALNQDRGRLQADAHLAAVKIADVTVERVTHIADTARPDNAPAQNSNGQPSQQGGSQSALAQGQGNGAQGENGQSGRKHVADAAVSNRAEPQDQSAGDGRDHVRRARYA